MRELVRDNELKAAHPEVEWAAIEGIALITHQVS